MIFEIDHQHAEGTRAQKQFRAAKKCGSAGVPRNLQDDEAVEIDPSRREIGNIKSAVGELDPCAALATGLSLEDERYGHGASSDRALAGEFDESTRGQSLTEAPRLMIEFRRIRSLRARLWTREEVFGGYQAKLLCGRRHGSVILNKFTGHKL